jgi:hypothetical protein
MVSGGISLAKGDFDTAGQKLGSIFSMPIKTTAEVISNKNYFGQPIYNKYDSGKEKAIKIAQHVGLSVNHPYIKGVMNQMTAEADKKKPLVQVISESMELPLKFSDKDKVSRDQFYRAVDKKNREEEKLKDKFRPTYEKVKKLAEEGNKAEALKIVNQMTDEEYEMYKNMKAADKRGDTKKGQADMYDTVVQVQKLVKEGKRKEAQAIVDGLSDEEYKLYKLAKEKVSN